MENATKALLISAAVLIAIVLIAVSIKILSSTQGVSEEVGSVTDATGKAIFNSQFTDYEGTQTGTEVRALLNKVVATWNSSSTRHIQVNDCTSANAIATYRATIANTSIYTVSVEYDSEGYVNKININ